MCPRQASPLGVSGSIGRCEGCRVLVAFLTTSIFSPNVPVKSAGTSRGSSVSLGGRTDVIHFVLQSSRDPLLHSTSMDELISFSARIPKSLAVRIEATAKRVGLNKSQYARLALEAFERRLMRERIAELSFRLDAFAASALNSMADHTSDSLK
jgi:hypothetical protein